MTLGPILPGRIPDSFSVLRTQRNLHESARELSQLQQQIATGQRYFYMSESVADALKTVQQQSTAERKFQAAINTQTNLSFLGATDAALAEVSNVLNSAKSLSLAAVSDTTTPSEKEHFVTELNTLIDSAINSANREFRGRKLFAGTGGNTSPFARLSNGVGFFGQASATKAFGDWGQILETGVDPTAAFATDVSVSTVDLNRALTTNTKLADLNGGRGVSGNKLSVTTSVRTAEIDLTGAETINDVILRIQDEFAGDAVTVTVSATATGLQITPSAGTVQVKNVSGHRLASDLGLIGPAASPVTGGDLNPRLSKTTAVASLLGGAGIANLNEGFQITIGAQTETVDFTGVTTVEDMLNAIEATGLPVDAGISADGKGISIVSRVAGESFSIGENGGTLAADLGLRTFSATTRLDTLNSGTGVPIFDGADPGTFVRDLEITRRDGTAVTVDLSAAETIQDVLDAINAVDPTVLTATFATTGNGIVLQDTSGVGTLTVADDAVSRALGINGSQTNAALTLDGLDTNPLKSEGTFGLLVQLRDAIESGELHHINRVSELLDEEISRFAAVRGAVGSNMSLISDTQDRIDQEQLRIAETLSDTFDADLAEVITRLSTVQSSYQATLQVSNTLLQLNLLNLL